jgi:rare lipoprotein A
MKIIINRIPLLVVISGFAALLSACSPRPQQIDEAAVISEKVVMPPSVKEAKKTARSLAVKSAVMRPVQKKVIRKAAKKSVKKTVHKAAKKEVALKSQRQTKRHIAPQSGATRQAPVRTITGKASYYGRRFHGRKTASGEIFDMNDMTAAHKTLPFGTRLRVINERNGRAVTVRINDRGPYAKGRVLDLSKAAARKIGLLKVGVARVRIELLE